jgi:hypothetical protein
MKSSLQKPFPESYEKITVYFSNTVKHQTSRLKCHSMRIRGWWSFLFILVASSLMTLPKAKSFEIHARKDTVISQLLDWRTEISSDQNISDRERDLRLQFSNRLLFQVERKYQETDLLQFMIDTANDMKTTDEMRDNQSYGGMNDFLENLADALKTLIEPRENVISFIRDFTQFCTLSKPCDVDQYAETRNYSDGKEMEKAAPMDIDAAAESVAQKIDQDDQTNEEKKEELTAKPSKDYLSLGNGLKEYSELQFVLPVQQEITEQSPETSR